MQVSKKSYALQDKSNMDEIEEVKIENHGTENDTMENNWSNGNSSCVENNVTLTVT